MKMVLFQIVGNVHGAYWFHPSINMEVMRTTLHLHKNMDLEIPNQEQLLTTEYDHSYDLFLDHFLKKLRITQHFQYSAIHKWVCTCNHETVSYFSEHIFFLNIVLWVMLVVFLRSRVIVVIRCAVDESCCRLESFFGCIVRAESS